MPPDSTLEIKLEAIGLGAGAVAIVTVSRWISTHASLSIDICGKSRATYSVPVSARPSGDEWIALALLRPVVFADATPMTLGSILFAGQPLPFYRLPATLRVGYNSPTSAVAVYEAARDGIIPAQQAALDAGGSTEEADTVRRELIVTAALWSGGYRVSSVEAATLEEDTRYVLLRTSSLLQND